jgi:2-polyprenyl-6-hydroxyphenyl methylase/3-demethylubiquinone-9 3-methyltransferase
MRQIDLCKRFDGLLPALYRIDGNRDFQDNFAPFALVESSNPLVYDVGGGRHPHLSAELKCQLGARVVGLDISQTELNAAPAGIYDEVVCIDLTTYHGIGDADVVICQTLMEHVADVGQAFRALASILKPDGKLLIFTPSRNAAFARLNLLLPEWLKRRILFGIFPHTRTGQGFRSFYDRCTPAEFRQIAAANGLQVTDTRLYYCSMYFSFCVPLHVIWRAWIVFFRWWNPDAAAETFAMILRKHT